MTATAESIRCQFLPTADGRVRLTVETTIVCASVSEGMALVQRMVLAELGREAGRTPPEAAIG